MADNSWMIATDPDTPSQAANTQPAAKPAAAPAPYPGYVDPNNQDPQALAAQLINSQFADWEAMYKPIELEALSQVSINNPKVLTDAVAKANTNATAASDQMTGIGDRQNRALGITPTAYQSQASNRIQSIDKSLNIAGAQNQARAGQKALDEKILFGTAPSPNIVNKNTMPSSAA